MNTLLHYLKKYRVQSILGPLFKLFEALFELVVPLVVARIIDDGIQNGDVGFILRHAFLLCGLAAVGFGFSITAQYFAAKASVGCATALRHDLLEKIHSLSFTQIDAIGTSTLLTRITGDVNLVQTGINMVLRLMLRSPFVVFGAMIMAFTIDAKAALIFVGVIVVLSLAVGFLMAKTIPMYKKVQGKLDIILRKTKENLSGAKVIRAFGLENKELNDFQNENESLNALQKLAGRVSSLLNPITYCIVNLGIIVLIYSGAFRVNVGALSQGELVALYNYMSQILVELVKFAGLIVTFNKSVAGMSRINTVLSTSRDEEGDQPLAVDEGAPAVSFEHVSFHYDGVAEDALHDITFEARTGETVGIIGGTGSGKTTLVNLISDFYSATQGTVRLFGCDVKEIRRQDVLDQIGIVPQRAVLFSGTIRQNLLWGNENADDDALMDAVRAAQAEDVVKAKDGGLDAPVEQLGANFSGGQRQRLTIARALVKKPSVLILDDSASALDYATEARLRQSLARFYAQSTVFIVSQRTSSIRHCDRILVLLDGELVGNGSHEELMRNCEEYRNIYRSQFKQEDAQ